MTAYTDEELNVFECKSIPALIADQANYRKVHQINTQIDDQFLMLLKYNKYVFPYDPEFAKLTSGELKQQRTHICQIYSDYLKGYFAGIKNINVLIGQSEDANLDKLKSKWNYPAAFNKNYFTDLINFYQRHTTNIKNTFRYLDIVLSLFYRKFNACISMIDSHIRAAEGRENILLVSDVLVSRANQNKVIRDEQQQLQYELRKNYSILLRFYDTKLKKIYDESKRFNIVYSIDKSQPKSSQPKSSSPLDQFVSQNSSSSSDQLVSQNQSSSSSSQIPSTKPIVSEPVSLLHLIHKTHSETHSETHTETETYTDTETKITSKRQKSTYRLISSTPDAVRIKKSKSVAIKVRNTKETKRRRVIRVSQEQEQPKQNPTYNKEYDKFFVSRDFNDRIKRLSEIAKIHLEKRKALEESKVQAV